MAQIVQTEAFSAASINSEYILSQESNKGF